MLIMEDRSQERTVRVYTDFHEVRSEHAEIHAQLRNWARWCFSRSGHTSHPMFRWAKPAQHWQAIELSEVTDPMAAMKMEKAVHRLPTGHQGAIRWSYVYQGPPRRAATRLGMTLEGLAELVHDGRSMLRNMIKDSA